WAEETLHVGDRGEANWPKSTQVFQRGIKAMEWSAHEVKRAASGCVDTNSCSAGCPKGAKQGVSVALIPRAEALGVRFLTGCRARLLLKSGHRITGVLAEIKREEGSSDLVRIDADHVFLCAGPTQTPTLLRRSGLKEHIGDSFQIHPMLKVTALFD